jgi:hypothetical protein
MLRWGGSITWGSWLGSERQMGLVEYFDGLDERIHARVSLGQAVFVSTSV